MKRLIPFLVVSIRVFTGLPLCWSVLQVGRASLFTGLYPDQDRSTPWRDRGRAASSEWSARGLVELHQPASDHSCSAAGSRSGRSRFRPSTQRRGRLRLSPRW